MTPPGTLCYCDLIQAYRNAGQTDAIIKQTKWNSIVYTFFGELVEKHHALKLSSKESAMHTDDPDEKSESEEEPSKKKKKKLKDQDQIWFDSKK